MASKDVTSSGSGQVTEVVLRDLQSLLRDTIGEQVQVVDYTTSSLLPVGENYGSSMLKVDAVIKKTKNSPEEKLALVAKMIPPSEFQQSVINATVSFAKEIFVFKKLLGAYREVEREAGIPSKDLIDILPKIYGGRLSLKKDSAEADGDAVLLLENLKVRGYNTMNRMNGLDLEHAKLAISELARFHALGIAVKQKKPEFFAEAKNILDIFPFIMKDNEFEDIVEHTCKTICSDPRTAKYADRIKASIMKYNWETLMNIVAVEPWVTMIHGDFWVNNMMFRHENGKIADIKFVDFQIMRACSPLKDLPYFLCGSTSIEVMDNHFDELLDIYHGNFIRVLKKVGCDTSPYSRDSFDKQLKFDASEELFHCLMAMKFFTTETSDVDINDMKGMMLSGGSSLYMERTWKVVSKFVEKEWL